MNFRSSRWAILATVSLGTFMAVLDGSIANVALPTLSRELAAPLHQVQWVITAYLLTICATLPIMGRLSDLLGRGRMYNYGFLVFTAGAILSALSGTIYVLIASRIVQAFGASSMMTNSQAIVAETFSSGDRGKAIGIVGVLVSLGALTGPGIGGVLVEHFGWSSIFWVSVPIGIIGFFAGLYILPGNGNEPRREPFDYLGSILFIVGIISLLLTLSNGQAWGWSSASVRIGSATAALALTLFYLWEKRTRYPMLDFSLYRNRTFAIGNIAALCSFVAIYSINVMMPFYLQDVLGFSAAKTGYTMMVNPIFMAITAPIAGSLSDRIGANLLTTAGLSINALAFAMLNMLGSNESAWVVGLHLALFGIGGGLFQSPNNSSIMGSVPRSKLGTAGGLNALVRNVGMVIGIALSVSLYSTRLDQLSGSVPDNEAMLGGLRVVFWMACGVCLLALAISARRMKVHREQDRTEVSG